MSAVGKPTVATNGASLAKSGAAGGDGFDGHELMAQLGSEVAAALSAALEGVNALATTGKIGRRGLRELRDHIELARRTGIMGQQVTRLASGRVRQSPERIDLTAALREALSQHRRQIESRGIEVQPSLGPAQVMADPTLIFTLLEAVLDWSFEHTRSPIELRIDLSPWPVQARLSSSFRYLTEEQIDQGTVAFGGSPLESMSWRLLQQAARTMDLQLGREESGSRVQMTLSFPRTVNDPSDTASPPPREEVGRLALNSKPLAGSHLLVVASRRETRSVVKDALRHMGLMVDFVTSVDEAREFCNGGMPHAVLHESALGGERFERLRKDLLIEVPTLVFIELSEDGHGFEMRKVGDRQFARVSRGSIIESLPAALMFELSRPR